MMTKKKKNSSLYCPAEQTNIIKKKKWTGISILLSFHGIERCFPPERKKVKTHELPQEEKIQSDCIRLYKLLMHV